MGIREVRSSWPREKGQPHPRLGESPGSRSSPDCARSDGGHRVHTVGKGGSMPAARRDNSEVVGVQRSPFGER
jgi:hypothetical protein